MRRTRSRPIFQLPAWQRKSRGVSGISYHVLLDGWKSREWLGGEGRFGAEDSRRDGCNYTMVSADLLPSICCAHVRVFRASDFLSGGPLEIAAPSDMLPYTKPVEEYSEDDYGWAEELEAYIFALTKSR